jgi:hypothetical protein
MAILTTPVILASFASGGYTGLGLLINSGLSLFVPAGQVVGLASVLAIVDCGGGVAFGFNAPASCGMVLARGSVAAVVSTFAISLNSAVPGCQTAVVEVRLSELR